MEDHVRKLCLTFAASLAVLSTGALPTRADGVPSGAGPIDRQAFEEAYRLPVERVHFAGRGHGRLVCTHFWNGRWHRRQVCFWAPRHRHYGGLYRHYRAYGQGHHYRQHH
jgi:hypothetical protein